MTDLKIIVLFHLFTLIVTQSADEQQSSNNPITRTSSSVDIQLCILNGGGILATQRADFQTVLLSHLRQNVFSNTAVYLERQYTTLSGSDFCYLYVYQAPNPDYSAYAVKQLAALTDQILHVPFKMPATGITVTIECKVDAAQWSGDDLTYLGTPIPFMWKVNDLLLWGSSVLSLLFVCMSGLCCYALCTRITPLGASGDANQEDNQILKVDKEILAALLSKRKNSAPQNNPLTKPMTLAKAPTNPKPVILKTQMGIF